MRRMLSAESATRNFMDATPAGPVMTGMMTKSRLNQLPIIAVSSLAERLAEYMMGLNLSERTHK